MTQLQRRAGRCPAANAYVDIDADVAVHAAGEIEDCLDAVLEQAGLAQVPQDLDDGPMQAEVPEEPAITRKDFITSSFPRSFTSFSSRIGAIPM